MKVPDSYQEDIRAMFQEHYKWLRHRISVQLGCFASGEDIASETFLQILSKPMTSPIREPKAFLVTVARRLLYQSWRRRDVERAYLASVAEVDEPVSMSLEEHAQVVEMLMTVDRLLAGLQPKIKATFLMSQIDGLTYPQIAEELGISERSVCEYMKKAFKRCLKVTMEER